MRIAFLFNHDQVHQVAHALPTAITLKRMAPSIDVIVATTNPALSAEVRRLAAKLSADVAPVELTLRRATTRFAVRYLDHLLPARKLAVYRDNLDVFRTLDALVVTEKTSLILKSRYGLDLPIIHTRHGAGDRAIGFDPASARFDKVLVSGPKIRQRLIAEAGVPAERISTVGYAKFDLLPDKRPRLPFQANGKPTVLYNPHASPHLSSWFRHGRAVLDHFLHDDRYNLIFAPHVMLFHRPLVASIDRFRIDRPGIIDQRYHDAPNIHIDLGSPASTDMTYTLAADLYLGDVSSQIYEFLLHPRPCLFLDSHSTDWRNDPNYAHWAAGPVITDPANLAAALDDGFAAPDRYRKVQQDLFARSFDLTAEPSARRAARAVLRFLGRPEAALPMRSLVQGWQQAGDRPGPLQNRASQVRLSAEAGVSVPGST